MDESAESDADKESTLPQVGEQQCALVEIMERFLKFTLDISITVQMDIERLVGVRLE